MGRYTPKYPRLSERLLDWFTEQRSQGKSSFYVIANFNTVICDEFVYQSWEWAILIGQFWNYQNTFGRVFNTLDSTEDEAFYSEETAELVGGEELDGEFDADTEDEQ